MPEEKKNVNKPATTTKKAASTTKKPASAAKKPTAPTKKAASAKKTTSAKKPASAASKKTTAKKPTKTPAVKKATPKKIVTQTSGISIKQNKNDTDNLLDVLSVSPNSQQPEKKQTAKPKAKKVATTKKPALKVQPKVKHRTKLQTKEEKQLYKRLSDSFNYVANLTMVIEERTMDKEQITDLTLGEIHVLEVVNKELEMPMTKVANQLKITVGSLTTCVNRLVKKEYLARVRDDVDHRVIKVSTTPKAKKILKLHDAFHEEILLSVLDGITLKDATKVMEQFERTLENYINPKEKNYESPITTSKKKK